MPTPGDKDYCPNYGQCPAGGKFCRTEGRCMGAEFYVLDEQAEEWILRPTVVRSSKLS